MPQISLRACEMPESPIRKLFPLAEAAKARGIVGIKGHRLVGGFRASCYNALPKSSVEALVACMREFAEKHA